jgi:hypothetical protein
MNRALYIILIPVTLVALGYILVFRAVGLAPGYPRMIVAISLFFASIWWAARKSARKANSGQP